MGRRTPFNWSLLDRETLYSMLYELKAEIVDKRLSIGEITSIISKHIKRHLPLKVTSNRYKPVKKGELWIGGAYHSYLDYAGNKRFIEIELSFPTTAETMKTSLYRWERICRLFADTVLHEVIHTRQYRARNFKDIPGYESTAYYAKDRKEQEYYGHRDEMGAHSFNLAQDMLDKFGFDPKAIRDYLDAPVPKRKKQHSWGRFMKAFEYNHDHPKVRQMKRKIMNQLEYAYIGKPFKTPNHLTY
jgi:uncharacterized protein YqiB (DUF1249 family)